MGTSRQRLAALFASALVCGAVLGWAGPAQAGPPKLTLEAVATALAGADDAVPGKAAHAAVAGKTHAATNPQFNQEFAALREFVARIEGRPAESAVVPAQSATDDPYSALLDFTQKLQTEQPIQAAVKRAVVVKTDVGEATFVGEAVCRTCHAAAAAEFDKTLMGRANKTTRKGTMTCEGCHGPGSAHVKAGGGRGVGGLISFRPEDPTRTAEENNAICLGCHQKGNRTAWHGSTHETRDLQCSNCHSVMKNITRKANLKERTELEVCGTCHKTQRAQMQRSSHMPVREGKMTCSNCHNPHGSVNGTESLIRQASINDNCYSCHAEKRAPVLWEHAPVKENCLNCHEAHGSNHEYLLKVQRPRLCAQCHSFAHGGQAGIVFNNNFAFGHSCNNCHVQIHGSNHPGGAFFHR